MDERSNKRLGKYLLKSRLGQGGMGVVYQATDLRLKREVAIKILPAEMMSDPTAVRRFLREARAIAKLSHPNVVAIHDVDQLGGCCFLVMELLRGGTAQDLIAHGPLPWEEATAIVVQACRGLVAAHDAGLIHRDVKPANLMLAADATVKVTDFGLAKVVDPALAAASLALTALDTIVGTPQYMSPEQCKGEQLDLRSDVYSLGATYYSLLTGQPPFADAPPLQLMFAHCSTPAPDPRQLQPNIPAPCADIVRTALAKHRTQRFATTLEMLVELGRLLANLPTLAIRNPPAAPNGGNPGAPMPPTIWEGVPPILDGQASEPDPPPAARKSVRKWGKWPGLLVVGCLVLAVALVAWNWSAPSDAGNEGGSAPPVQPRTALVPGVARPITLQPAHEVPGIKAEIRSVAFSPDGKSLYAGSMAGEVCQWDLAGGAPALVRKFSGTTGGIRALAVQRRWLAAGGLAKTVWLWHLDSEKPRTSLVDFVGEVSSLAISPDGRRLAVGTYSEARLYELDDSGARLLKVLGTSVTGSVKCYMVMSVAFSSDSRWLAATSWADRTLAVWDASNGVLRSTKQGQSDDPMAVTFLPGSDNVLFGLHHDGLRIWDSNKAAVRSVKGSAGTDVRSLAVLPDGRTATVVGAWGGSIRLYDLHRDAPGPVISASTGTSSVAVAISADGRWVATAGGGENPPRGYLHLWNVVPKREE